MNTHRIAVAAASGVAVLALGAGTAVAGPASPPAPTNTPKTAYQVKTFHKVGKAWTVEVTSVDRNANAACRKADPAFYHKPKKGYVYVVVQFTGRKLTGGQKQNLGEGIYTNLLAKDGKQYGQVYGIVAPHDASSAKTVGKGGRSSGGFTYEIKQSEAKAGHLETIVEGTGVHDTTPFFFHT
jgi:hypothetical protein